MRQRRMRRLPVLLWQPGNGFQWDEYDEVMRAVASHGFLVAVVDNRFFMPAVSRVRRWGLART